MQTIILLVILLKLQQLAKLMAHSNQAVFQLSVKRLYQLILSAKEPTEELTSSINSLIQMSISSSKHFSFLLHRIRWFESPFTSYRLQFFKICRLYRTTSRQTSRVIHNLIIEGFFSANTQKQSLDCLKKLLKEGSEQKDIFLALRQNYPHKLCSLDIHTLYMQNMLDLCHQFIRYRVDLLEIIVQNLVKFDTEVVIGDQEVHNPSPNDSRLVEYRKNTANSELATKLDHLLNELILYLESQKDDEALLNELLLIFQKKVLPIKTTKNIQLLIFIVAQQNKSRSKAFVSFLLSNIFQQKHTNQQNWFRIISQSCFYLFSYLERSKTVSSKATYKTLLILMQKLRSKLDDVEPLEVNKNTELKVLLQSIEVHLLLLQTIIIVKTSLNYSYSQEFEELFNQLIQDAQDKLHFEYFIKEQILAKIGVQRSRTSTLKLKFSNKFLPSTLQKTGQHTDPLMKIKQQTIVQRQSISNSNQLRKLVKGETPISYCSDTLI